MGTVYKVLDSLVENELLKKVKTEKDIMRYDAVLSHHHHLYCAETDRIEDYEDENLNKFINEYFIKNKIKNFKLLVNLILNNIKWVIQTVTNVPIITDK